MSAGTAKSPVATPKGQLFAYHGRAAKLLKQGVVVRGVAEARCGWILIEAIGHAGKPVRFPVKQRNLRPYAGLF